MYAVVTPKKEKTQRMVVSATIISIVLIARLCLGVILLSSAVGKLRHRHAFMRGVLDYRVLPEHWARFVALLIPWVELLLTLMLLTGFMLKLAGLLTIGFLIAVSTAISINLQRGRAIKCNCHGIVGSKTISWGIIARNGLLAVLAAVVSVWASNDIMFQWNAELALFVTPASIVVAGLLLGFCFVLLQLIEWTVLIHERVAQLRRQAIV